MNSELPSMPSLPAMAISAETVVGPSVAAGSAWHTRCVMCANGMFKSENGQNRALYLLRSARAILILLERMDVQSLAKQMGDPAALSERRRSKLTATMAAARLA